MLHSEPLSEAALSFAGLKHQELEGTVLSTIINHKIASLQKLKPVSGSAPGFPRVSLYKALSGEGRHFILECKKSSPTLGDFASDFNLDRLIDCYNHRASAISVLCEERFFKGSLSYLNYVKQRTPLPVLCKDFILCKEQIDAAALAGADAILLMLSVLTEEKFTELYEYAHDLSLEVLCEVSTEEEARFASRLGVRLAGINNRNLKTLKVDLTRAPALAACFKAPTVVISESGLSAHHQLQGLLPVHNYLVGSSLTGSKNLYVATNSLLYGVNKVCGLTTEEAVEACIRHRVALGGLIFVPGSKRCVSIKQAQRLKECAKGKLGLVGVFQNASLDTVVQTVSACGLFLVQLHGEESPDYLVALKERLKGVGLIKAISPDRPDLLSKLAAYQELCSYLLLDSSTPGSGTSLDFTALPKELDRHRTILAGGIGLDNLQEALSLGFAGLDLNSKLERTPGRKDPDLIARAFELINRF